jgi:hypothetical protein
MPQNSKAMKATMEVCLACIDEAQPVIKFLASTPEECIFNGLNTFLFDNTSTRRIASLNSLYGKATVTRTVDQEFLTMVSFTPSISDSMKTSLHMPDVGVVYNAMDAETWLQMTVDALLCTRHSSVISKIFIAWDKAQDRFQENITDSSMQAAEELPSLPTLPPLPQNVMYT